MVEAVLLCGCMAKRFQQANKEKMTGSCCFVGLMLVLLVVTPNGSCKECPMDIMYTLYEKLESALVTNNHTLFLMRDLFFPITPHHEVEVLEMDICVEISIVEESL